VPFDHVRAESLNGKMGSQLMAIAAEAQVGRVYLPPDPDQIAVAKSAKTIEFPDTELPERALGFRVQVYGMKRHRDLFTPRQLVALTTFSDLVSEARRQAISDGGSDEYGNAVATYLAFAVDRTVDRGSTICTWDSSPKMEALRNTFARHAIPMTWDFAEANPFSESSGNWLNNVEWAAKALAVLGIGTPGSVKQLDATAGGWAEGMFSTDPPYYDNIGYADLSDFFYVWLRRSLVAVYPDIFSTLLVPKSQELVATPYRFDGSRERAQQFFEAGFGRAFVQMRQSQTAEIPLTVYYAFKQSESEEDDDDVAAASMASTGWETMLEGMIRSDFQVTGTWPLRSELSNRPVASGTNALASSIVLACRPRPELAPITTRREFISSLKKELPQALRDLQKGNIAPVDLAQAAIGPGMAVFSRYNKVLETDGSPMRVRTALGLINQTLDEVLSEQEGEFDPDTRWALAWFEQHAFDEGLYGEAEVLATAKALSVSALDETKILHSRAGKVRLLRRDELSADWNPTAEHRLTVWAVTQHLIRSLDKNGETATATLASKVGGLAETARDLAYRLYILSERKGWAEEAGYYNSLVVSWPAIAPKAFALS
jgi:putative DNA methylase